MLKTILLLCFVGLSFSFEVEENFDTAQIIEYNQYPTERHYVTTDDGYIIEIQRIPRGRDNRPAPGCKNNRPVLFLMHGLFGSSFQFVLNLPSQSPAYIFADAGFDVWIGNVRGTRYGRNHTHLKPTQFQFWNFSLYEYQNFDLRQEIEYVLEYTGQESLYYVGHSQGCTIMLQRLAAADESWQKKIKFFFALAPSGGFYDPVFPFTLLENQQLQKLIQVVLEGLDIPISVPNILTALLARFCNQRQLSYVCQTALNMGAGAERLSQFNTSRIPIFVRHFPSVTSTLTLLNWAQIFRYHEMRRLDLGPEKNVQFYGQPEAPIYNLTKIVAPTIIYSSGDDHIADEIDVRNVILKHYGPGLRKYYCLDHFTHFDFTVGLRANDEIYKPIIYQIYEEIAKNNDC